jgi:hypothetical protein
LVRAIIKAFQLAQPADIFSVIDNYWSFLCDPYWDMQFLRELVQDEFLKAIEDGRRPPLSPLETRQFGEKQRQRRWAKRQANAKLTKSLAEELGCTIRYASMLRKDGTTNPVVAQKMAEHLGTAVEDHLREKLKTGRQVDFPSWFLKLAAPGGSFRDFLSDDQLKLPRKAEILAATLREMKGDAWIQLAEVDTLERLLQFCASFKVTPRPEAPAIETWTEFKLWKIELVAALATRMVKENLQTDSFHQQHQWRAGNG